MELTILEITNIVKHYLLENAYILAGTEKIGIKLSVRLDGLKVSVSQHQPLAAGLFEINLYPGLGGLAFYV